MLLLIAYHQIWLKRNKLKYQGEQPSSPRVIANTVWNFMELSLKGVLFCFKSFAEEKIEAIEELVAKYNTLLSLGPQHYSHHPSSPPVGPTGRCDNVENRWRLHLTMNDGSC